MFESHSFNMHFSNNSLQFLSIFKRLLMGAHFGDGFKVGSIIILNDFMSIPYYSLFTIRYRVLFILWRHQQLEGFKGRHGKIWFMIMTSMTLGIKLPTCSWIASARFLQGETFAWWTMVLDSKKVWEWIGITDCANKVATIVFKTSHNSNKKPSVHHATNKKWLQRLWNPLQQS
jgi:hypothetical protein